MARSEIRKVEQWDNYHKLGPWPLKWLISTMLSPDGMLSSIEKYRDAAVEIRRLIQEAIAHGERFRPFSSS